MDKKLLDALNNLSVALESISQALAGKSEASSATAKALQGGDFITEIKEINVGVKALQKDTKEILANQQTIMKMASSKAKDSKTSDVENMGKDKTSQKNFKEGIGVILLIAVAVLALGVAFNIVGKVNFLSVIALALALPLLAIGFSKVLTTLKTVGFNAKEDGKNFLIAIGVIALSITMSSWILGMIIPLSFTKAMTATFIALTFALLAPSIHKFMLAFKDMSWMEILKASVAMVVILPAMALGIAFASWAFQLIKPIGIMQFLTAVGISLVFVVISYGLRKMLKSFKGMDMVSLAKSVLFLPLVLPAVALGIALSSYALQLVKPIGFIQLLTAIGISIAFTAIAYGLNKMLTAFKGIDPAQAIAAAIMLPILFVAISYAIAYSSVAFSQIVPIKFSQFLTAIGIAAVFVVISFGLKVMAKAIAELRWKDVLLIPALFTVMSLAITVSSFILSKATSIPFAKLMSILGFSIVASAAVVVMSGAMWLLSKMGIGIKDAIIGGLLTVIISTAIMISSHILALGNYKDYPNWKWTLGVGLSLIAFIPAILALGLVATTGIGIGVLLAGAVAVLGVAATISAASHILASGKYQGGPPVWWAMSTALALTAFTAGMVLLGGMIVASFGLGAVALAAGGEAVLMVAQTIVDTSFILKKGSYTGGPTKAWAEGIAISLGAFSPVYGMLMANKIFSLFGGGGVGPDDFATAIKTISQGIVDAAGFFADNTAAFVNGPPKAWAEGVGLAIGAFAPVYQVLADNSGWLASGVSVEDMSKAIMTISRGIVDAATFFNSPENTGVFDVNKVPSKAWAEGVGGALGAFSPIFNALSKDTGWFTSGKDVIDNMLYGITSISFGIVQSAMILSTGKSFFTNTIDPNFVKKLSKNIIDYMALVDTLSKYKTSSFKSLLGKDPVENIANGMVKIAGAYDKLARAIKNFSTALNGMDVVKVNSFTRLTGNLALLSAMDSNMFSNMLKVIESRSGVFANLLKVQSAELGKRPGVNVAGSAGSAQSKKAEQFKDNKGEDQLQKLDKMIILLKEMTKSAKSIDEHLQNPTAKKNEDIGAQSD
jgi:hypothetical protein